MRRDFDMYNKMYRILYIWISGDTKVAVVNVTELRARLKTHLTRLEDGEEITIICNSIVIGRLLPPNHVEVPAKPSKSLDTMLALEDKQVKFRQLNLYENPEAVIHLQRLNGFEIGRDLGSPGDYYDKLNGEFWVGELDGEVVATGAFDMCLGSKSDENQAELKRLAVKPDLSDKGIDKHMLKLLISQARSKGYKTLKLSQTAKNLV